ncbi:cbb3-type cytochrome c oxidase subunit I [Aquihabitans sp. McL0605]|uniref:cbb3-type cytochrome c oxidase subunit I n=1 Tax=Aquihabitans sp. McL0605 TaxID=3415671 RepID=UPI003CE76812
MAGVLGSGDHKVIGRLFIVTSLILGLVVLALSEGFVIEAIKPETLDIFTSDTAYQLFTLARIGFIFLLAMPLVIGVAMVVVPLQVGARTIAFPRAAAASFWGWFLGSLALIGSYIGNGGPGGGSSIGVNLWITSMGLIVISLLLASICLATTVLALRPTGMYLQRVPLFSWSAMIAALLWLLTLPVLFALIVLMYVDHRSAGSVFVGNPATLYGSLTWLFRNPQIYVVAIPVLGFVADVLATTSGARMQLRSVAQSAIAVFGILSFGAFLVAPSASALDSPLVLVMGLVAVLPLLALAAACADLFRKGSFKLHAGVVYAVSAFLILLLGVAAGALGSFPNLLDAPKGTSVSNSIYFVGVSTAVLLATVIASLGAIHWWATKIGRRPANEKLGLLAPLVLLLGSAMAVIPDLVAGLTGKGLELNADYTGGSAAGNGIAAAGIGLLALGVLIAVISFLPLFKKSDDEVEADPWNGLTLEWLAPSPPPLDNFVGDIPVVTSAEPLIDLREEK